MSELRFRWELVSELKCCNKCGAYYTCTHKGECCPECQWFDPTDNLCLAIPERKRPKPKPVKMEEKEVDPETFLFEDDDDDEDVSDLPPERDAFDDDDFVEIDAEDW
ncbi:MAG: hypothetical protein ACP6KW_03430 [Candidatus Thorarchaeota archaeon]